MGKAQQLLVPTKRGGAGTSYLLDTYTATAAYSTRQLRTGQTNCLRIRRASDNAEQDFGFVDGWLDTASIATFLTATTGYAATWYDQSGSGNNATQSTAGSQPLYVAVGDINSKPCLRFDGTDDYLSVPNVFSGSVAMALSVVRAKGDSFGQSRNGGVWDTGSQNGNSTHFSGILSQIYDDFGGTTRPLVGTASLNTNYIYSCTIKNGTTREFWLNSNTTELLSETMTPGWITTPKIGNGGGGTPYYFNGDMTSVIVMLSYNSGNFENIMDDLSDAWGITLS